MKYHLIALCVVALAVATSAGIVRRSAPPCAIACEDTPLDISFIVDSSSSIWPENFTLGLWFVSDFVDRFTIGPETVLVSMVTFGDKVYDQDSFQFLSHTNKASLKQAIVSMPFRHGTATETGAAIRWFMENQYPDNREGVKHALVVLTDGNSQEPEVTKEEADKAKAAGVEVYAIGVGHYVLPEELHNIASDDEHVYDVVTYNALSEIVSRLVEDTCGGPGEIPKPEPIKIDCRYSPVDISFVIDSSTSLGAENFTIELQFIRAFLEDFDIQPSAARVAAVMFGDRVYEEKVINFDAYTTKEDTLDAILNLEWMHGTSTQTGAGIDYMVDKFMPHFRPYVPHIGIVVTDGKSQEKKETAKAAMRARENGITMVAVGVGKVGETISQEELDGIAGDPRRVLTADNFARLDSIRQSLISVTCANIERLQSESE